jgi:LysR family transcriptional regulator, transcription activator of glutamate synthase operon
VELRHLRSLVTLAREGNFTRAARRLRIAQPALSLQIRALERELGVLLVARTNRTSGLTDAGARLVARAEEILLAVQDATQEMRTHAGEEVGTVRIGCALQTLVEGRLPGLLASFHRRHPRIRIALREVHTRQVLELLQRGEADLGLIHLGRVGATVVGMRAAGQTISLARLHSEPIVLIVDPGHRLANRTTVELDDLREETFVSFRSGATVRQMLLLATRRAGFAPRIGFATANMGTVRAFVSAGLGVAFVPRSALDVPSPPLTAISIASPRMERVITLARNTARYEPPAVKEIRRLLSDALRGGATVAS